MRTLSVQGLQQVFSQNVTDVFLPLLEVDNNYLVSDTESLVFEEKEYQPFPFDMALPEEKEGSIPSIELSIDNVDRRLISLLRSVSSPPDCKVCVVRKTEDSVIQEIDWMSFSMINIQYDDIKVSATLSFNIDYLNEPATKDNFNYNTAPGLYG